MTEKQGEKEKGANPGASGVNDAQMEIFARMQDFSSKWYSNLNDALFALKRDVAKVLVVNLQKPTRYVYITRDYANANFYFVKEFSEDEVFRGNYGPIELQKMTEEQLINLLSS
jgi:hypothetical protein